MSVCDARMQIPSPFGGGNGGSLFGSPMALFGYANRQRSNGEERGRGGTPLGFYCGQ